MVRDPWRMVWRTAHRGSKPACCSSKVVILAWWRVLGSSCDSGNHGFFLMRFISSDAPGFWRLRGWESDGMDDGMMGCAVWYGMVWLPFTIRVLFTALSFTAAQRTSPGWIARDVENHNWARIIEVMMVVLAEGRTTEIRCELNTSLLYYVQHSSVPGSTEFTLIKHL